MDNKPNLWVFCGLQGSGKSTEASSLFENAKKLGRSIQLLSSDALRKEYANFDNNKIFNVLYTRMNNYLNLNHDVIIDATNITIKARAQIFNNLKYDCAKICVIMNTPYIECVRRVKVRNEDPESHDVPLDVLDKYHKSFEIPFKEEGWDYIIFKCPLVVNGVDKDIKNMLVNMMVGYDQRCKWHEETLDVHCEMVKNYLIDNNAESYTIEAAELHDFGKLKTQKPKKDDPTEMCYYRHESVGAYDLMCIPDIFTNPLESLFIINYHMQAFNINDTEKSYNKALRRFGQEKLEQLLLFNKADQAGAIRRKIC